MQPARRQIPDQLPKHAAFRHRYRRWRPHWPRIAAVVFVFTFSVAFWSLVGWGIAALIGGKP